MRTAADRVRDIMLLSTRIMDELGVHDSQRGRICELAAKKARDQSSPLFKSPDDEGYARDFREFVAAYVGKPGAAHA